MRQYLQSTLAGLARRVIATQRPFVVGITGSVGKTSVKRAIAAVLAQQGSVRADAKNYNNEIGFPIAIIGGSAPGRSALAWGSLLVRGWWLGMVRSDRYPRMLVLEYGADHPGDLHHLIGIARPHIAVVTAVGPAHTEFFESVEGVIAEKRTIVAALPSDGVAILNADDGNVIAMRSEAARTVTYGLRQEADVRGLEVIVTSSTSQASAYPSIGVAFKLAHGGSVIPVHLDGCIGDGHVFAALAATAIGLDRGMNLVDISRALSRYVPPPSRLRVLSGIKRTTLLDDSYNSSPLAAAVAIDALVSIQTHGRRIAVLGDMLELGVLTERAHEGIGALVASRKIDALVTVGGASRHTASAACAAGMPAESVVEFHSAADAGRHVQDILRQGDVVLVKGSQGMRMERVVVELTAEPLRKAELVCRQDAEWMGRS